MCGITGILHFGRLPDASQKVKSMANSLAHRGPDEDGFWTGHDVALGFRRLAIIDIATGTQPMSNEDGTVWVVYNGEIYNHRELRRTLEACGHKFRTDHCDTEVLVHGWEQWGESLPEKLNGMFAFALWDQRTGSLVLARDRLGIKPLYIANDNDGNLLFGSEARAVFASGLLEKRVKPEGLFEYLAFQNNWNGRTPFKGIELMQPGVIAIHRRHGSVSHRFWSLSFSRQDSENFPEVVADYREMLLDVMRRQMDADVPVMSYLSGGIDSSAVTVAAHRLDRKVRAYSCIFNLEAVGQDRIVDEREYSRKVAGKLGIDRVEMELANDILASTLDATIAALEYPRMGMSYVNYLIAGRVSEDARVVMSGMGGDELHGGYIGRYLLTPRPTGRRGVINFFSRLSRRKGDAFDPYRSQLNFPVKFNEMEIAFTTEFRTATRDFSPRDEIETLIAESPSRDPWDVVMYGDIKTYLHGLLVLEDKLSMAHSLETRVPLLDNEVIDFALKLPWKWLIEGEAGKMIFREAVKPWVPEEIYKKPKMGFGPPDASWYRGALKPWILDQLSEVNIRRRGVFNPEFIQKKLNEHFSGDSNHVALIWSLLSLESWFRVHGFADGVTV